MANGYLINHRHDDGRNCIIGPDGKWRHWDFDGDVPGPADPTPETICDRAHPVVEERRVNIDGPEPVRVVRRPGSPTGDAHGIHMRGSDGRGDFGMPGLGTIKSMGVSVGDLVAGALSQWNTGPITPDFKMTVTQGGITVDYGEVGHEVDAATPDAEYILCKVLPSLLPLFLEKNRKYARAQTGHDLGVKGIIPDINRKTSVLITRLWDGEEAGSGESTEEIIDDLIGHLLLMRAKMRNM